MPDDEFRVRIHISKLKPDAPRKEALHNPSLAGHEEKNTDHRTIDLKIGFIQFLKIGSVWINGEPQIKYRAIEESFEIENPNLLQILPLSKDGYAKIHDEWIPILTNYQYRFHTDAKQGSYVAIWYGHETYDQVIIPSTVIFQSCYVTSPKAASKILFGQLDKLIDLNLSGFIDEHESIFRVHIHQDYKTSEGPLLANLAVNKSAKRNLNILRQNLVVMNNAIDKDKRNTAIKVGFPFSEALKIKVLGKKIVYNPDKVRKNKESGFLVSEIIFIDATFPFDAILPVRKNSGEPGKTKDENLQPAFGGIEPVSAEPGDPIDLVEEDVSVYLEDSKVDLPAIFDLSHIKIIKHEKEYQKFASMPFKSLGLGQVVSTGAGVGDKRQIDQGASQLDVALHPVKLEEIFKVIELLRNDRLDIEVLAVQHAFQNDKGIVNYFSKDIKGCYSWHLTSDKSRPRAYVIAQLYSAGQFYYLVDVEAKGKGVLSIALIRRWDHQSLSIDFLRNLMRDVARENGWAVFKKTNYERDLKFFPIDHCRKGDHLKVAKNILKKLKHNN